MNVKKQVIGIKNSKNPSGIFSNFPLGKRIIICMLVLMVMLQLASAAEVCVVVDYGSLGGEPDGDCVDIDEGKNGYELLNEVKWDIEWADFGGDLGHGLCGINEIGGTSDNCWIGDKYWNFLIAGDGEWHYTDYSFDGNSHYETKDGDFLGLAYGIYGSKPDMFEVNVSKIYVDGEKQTDSKTRNGKIVDVFPESTIEIKIDVENLYDSDTKIEITDISIEGTLEEIDDGSDVDVDVNEFDLAADREVTKELKFTIPLEVEEKDRLLKIEIDAEDDAGIKYSEELTFDVEIKKDSHSLRILESKLNKESYDCNENALLSISAINIGSKDEDVRLRVTNSDLGIDITKSFELSNDAFEGSSRYEDRFTLSLPKGIKTDSYPINLALEYGSEKEETNIDLVIKQCVASEEDKEESEEEQKEETTDVKIKDYPTQTTTEAGKEEAEGETIQSVERIDTNLDMILGIVLGILVVVIVGLLIIFWLFRK